MTRERYEGGDDPLRKRENGNGKENGFGEKSGFMQDAFLRVEKKKKKPEWKIGRKKGKRGEKDRR